MGGSAGTRLFFKSPISGIHSFSPDLGTQFAPFLAIPEKRRITAQFEQPKQRMDPDHRQVVQGSPVPSEAFCVETPNVNSQTGTPSNHSTPVVHSSATATPLAMGRGDLGDSMFNSL